MHSFYLYKSETKNKWLGDLCEMTGEKFDSKWKTHASDIFNEMSQRVRDREVFKTFARLTTAQK